MEYINQNLSVQYPDLPSNIDNIIENPSIVNDDNDPYQLNIDFSDNNNLVEQKLYKKEELIKQKEPTKLSFITDDNRIIIEQEDVITFLKKQASNSVDLILTDPAYSGMNQMLKLGKGKIIGKYSDKGDGQKWFDEFHDTKENYEVFLKECYRILKPNRHIYLMFDSYSLLTLGDIVREVFDVKNIIVWDKINIGLGHYFRRRHEFILFASKGKRSLNSKDIPDVWRIKRITGFKYPTQKPTELFELMLAGSAEKDFVVCDPFLGSGSSAIASIKRNCKFIGCDIAATSIQISTERVTTYLATQKDILQNKNMCDNEETMKKILDKNG
ncbi:MAG: site-specific DNA-methyltransferase [Microscillaceae bacterium]|nr:site-specific DNA-methyltransferase [Microscillaceae bacterium]